MNMVKQLHFAAQYLATAGISFLEKKDDDSHSNLGFSVENGRMTTRSLNNEGHVLALNYNNFSLEWITKQTTTNFRLDGSTHAEVLAWITQMTTNAGIAKPYVYKFHYELPYSITADFKYTLLNMGRLEELMHYRILAQLTLETFLKEQTLDSEIRTWPHHFDTGAFAMISDKIGLGLGLSIPDATNNDFYFYISGYEGHTSMATTSFKPLTYGEWYNEGFKGGILPVTNVTRDHVLTFFNEAFLAYKTDHNG